MSQRPVGSWSHHELSPSGGRSRHERSLSGARGPARATLSGVRGHPEPSLSGVGGQCCLGPAAYPLRSSQSFPIKRPHPKFANGPFREAGALQRATLSGVPSDLSRELAALQEPPSRELRTISPGSCNYLSRPMSHETCISNFRVI